MHSQEVTGCIHHSLCCHDRKLAKLPDISWQPEAWAGSAPDKNSPSPCPCQDMDWKRVKRDVISMSAFSAYRIQLFAFFASV